MIEDHLSEDRTANRSVEDIEPEEEVASSRKSSPKRSWLDIMEEDEVQSTEKEMEKLSVKEKKETEVVAKVIIKDVIRESTPKRRRNPSPPDEVKDDGDSDLEFQIALRDQKRKVNREVAKLKKMVEEDEERQTRRQEKRSRLDRSNMDSLLFVEESRKGGVTKTTTKTTTMMSTP
jgi:hypothetical protein